MSTAPDRPAVLGGSPRFAAPIYVTRPRLPDHNTFSAMTAAIFERRWLTNDGENVRSLEERLRKKLGAGFCAAINNATVALLIALRSLEVRGEVITTPFTFPATVHAIEWSGLTPVFCDVDPLTYNLDVTLARSLVTSQTSALLPVHVFGNPCDVVGIESLAKEKRLKVVYDAAHAFAVEHRGRGIGNWGDLSVFSFHATKLFHTAEGGALTGPTDSLRAAAVSLRNFGIVNEDLVRGIGINGKLSEIHSALGLCMLNIVDDEIRARGERVRRYREGLTGIDGILFQRLAPETVPNHAYFAIEIDAPAFGLTRDEFHLALRAENIITRKYFYPLASENVAYRHLPSANPERLPNAHRLASRVMCFPLYGDLPLDGVDSITDCVRKIQSAAPRVREAVKGNA